MENILKIDERYKEKIAKEYVNVASPKYKGVELSENSELLGFLHTMHFWENTLQIDKFDEEDREALLYGLARVLFENEKRIGKGPVTDLEFKAYIEGAKKVLELKRSGQEEKLPSYESIEDYDNFVHWLPKRLYVFLHGKSPIF